MNYSQVKEYLFGLKYHGAKYGIDRMLLLAEAMGQPQRTFPVIHVAGTNGKGSVAAMLESIYRGVGLRTGMFTSPHLVHLGERVQVNRRNLSPEAICAYTAELRKLGEAIAATEPDAHPSFFEFMTGMAFLHFAREQVDVGIIEVGLGGELDATNVVSPALTIITSIGYDHMPQLGNTLGEIARAKAGIIKPRVPLILGQVPPEAEAVILEIAAKNDAPVHKVTDAFGTDLADYPQTNLDGEYQRLNAATATLAARVLRSRFPISHANISAGLHAVNWPGRWQAMPLHDNKTLILDTSHNIDGARQLDRNLHRLVRETGEKPRILAGVLGDYRARALLEVVALYAREILFIRPAQQRACSVEELAACLPEGCTVPWRRGDVQEVFPAKGVCAVGDPGETLVATGSIYLMGEILDRLQNEPPASEESLQDGPLDPLPRNRAQDI